MGMHCELVHKPGGPFRPKVVYSQEADMRVPAYQKMVMVALPLVILTALVLGARFVEAQTYVASDLGPGWQCHKLAHVEICDRV